MIVNGTKIEKVNINIIDVIEQLINDIQGDGELIVDTENKKYFIEYERDMNKNLSEEQFTYLKSLMIIKDYLIKNKIK